MKTRHTTVAPAGVSHREIKLAKVVETAVPVPTMEGEEPKTIVKKALEFSRAFRSRMNSRMARKARKSGVEFLTVPA